MESHLVGLDVLGLRPLDQHPPRLDGPPAEPLAQRQRTGQRSLCTVPCRWQVITVYGEDQRIPLRPQAEAQVGAFGDDALVAHQALETFGQGAAGHQGVAHHMKRSRPDHPRHVQADRFIARQLYSQLPKAGHGILREARIGVVEGSEIQAELLEHGWAIEPFQLERLHNP
ncbi:hypothetical protein D3C73_1029090 [compost metagenome]